VTRLGLPVQPRDAIWAASCDGLVPGARPGALDARVAKLVAAEVVVPVANAPYTVAGLRTLEARGISAHADFVASGGGAMAYLSPAVARASDPDDARRAVDVIMSDLVTRARANEKGAYAGAAAIAEAFVRTWAPESDWPSAPPLV
jgi:glutamate dehydrogenase/leucine dehydrogenase